MYLGNIIEDIKKNRTNGADRLVAEYKSRLYKVAYGICGDEHEAEDLVFRTFEQVIAKIDDYQEQDAFFSWMCTILRNYHRMSVRATVARNTIPSGGPGELAGLIGGTDADGMDIAIDGNMLREAVDNLPQKLREVVVLHYFMDQPVRKVAKMLSIARGTVKSRLYYARLVLGTKFCEAMKKPTVTLTVAGLFIAAAVSAVSLVVLTPPMLAEVDEPVFMDDAPLQERDEVSEPWGFAPQIPHRLSESAKVTNPFVTQEPRRSVKSAAVPAFKSTGKDVRVMPIHSFDSTSGSTRVIISR